MNETFNQALDVHNPYYLHPSENPATALVSPVLDPTNYNSWSRSMLIALSAKNKLEFVDGTISEPQRSNSLHSTWRRCNNMVISWIVHSVSTSIRQSILWMDKAVDVWKDLKSRYAQGDLMRISYLQHEATSIKQADISVMDFFTKLCVIWDELESFRPNAFCSCSIQCSCGALLIVMERKKEDQIMQFLRGLNDQYANVRSSILLMDPLPPITKVFSYVVQQERQTLGSAGVLGSLNLESRDYSSVNAASSKQSTNCSFCGRLGHTESVCYRKHGFPMNGSNNKNNQSRSAKMCSHCGKTGHTVDVCYRKHGYPPRHKFHNSNNS